jgi:hypothetical protein
MHQSLQENHRITNQKAGETVVAQLAVAAAGVCLSFGMVGAAVAALFR